MKSLLTAAVVLASLIASTSTQAQNFNVINGNANRVFNGGVSGGFGGSFSQPVSNFNGINGNGNTIINGGSFQSGLRAVSAPPVFVPQQRTIVHHPTTFPHHFPAPRQPIFRQRSPRFNFNSIQGNRNVISNRSRGGIASGLGGLLGGVNVNINRVRGNNNSIINQ